MQKTKKICCRITPRRIIGAVVIAASIVNVFIVGAAYKVVLPGLVPISQTPTSTLAPFPSASVTPVVPTQIVPTSTNVPTQTFTATATYTSTSTPTDTPTATFTDTPSRTPTQCVPQYSWQVYIVKRGDTLYELAPIMRSSVPELMLANCLPNTTIYVGQLLYVPYLPPPTPTDTPIDTPVIPTNGPTVFQSPSACYFTTRQIMYSIYITVIPFDLEGIRSLVVTYEINGGPKTQLAMTSFGNYYAAT